MADSLPCTQASGFHQPLRLHLGDRCGDHLDEIVIQPDLVELTPERRDRLKAFISASDRLPDDVKTRILAQLDADRVPASMVERIEARIGG